MNSTKPLYLLLPSFLLPVLLLLSACDTATGELGGDIAVIEAFLFAGEPVDSIRVTSTIPFSSSDTVATTIDDAQLRLIRNEVAYNLTPRGTGGYYYYAGDDLEVTPGDYFRLEMEYEGQVLTAETEVPRAPESVSLDTTAIVVPSFEIGVGRPPRGGGGPGFGNGLLVSWDNAADELHYVVVRGLEDAHEAIFPDFLGQRIQPPRFISEPTRDNFYEINILILEGLGRHEVRVYRVNQEYADLYENRAQDSRDLNEPPDNITGGLGVFSAFNSVAIPFDVVRAE